MASISRDKGRNGKHNGRRTLWIIDANSKRIPIRLGLMSARAAAEVKSKIELIMQAAAAQISWEREVAEWVGKLAETAPLLYDKFHAKNLLPARAAKNTAAHKPTKLGEFLDGYLIERKGAAAESTLAVDKQAKDLLVERFGREKLLSEFTEGDADRWRAWLTKPVSDVPEESGRDLALNTARKRTGIARRMFKAAVRDRLLEANPFATVRGGTSVKSNKSRNRYIEREIVAKVIEAAPNDEFRLVIALSRFAGLRVPSEIVGLRWQDINWELGHIRVESPKTKNHAGGEERIVPIFGDLRPFLDKAYFDADPDDEFVLKRYRRKFRNLRPILYRAIQLAGVSAWGKPFMNMRRSMATDLIRMFPQHLCTTWLGHTEAVAEEFYYEVTSADYAQAQQMCMQRPAELGGMAKQINSHDFANASRNGVFPEKTHRATEVLVGLNKVNCGRIRSLSKVITKQPHS